VTSDIADLERRAREVLPSDVYDFYAGGSGREATLGANVEGWRGVPLLPRVLRDVSVIDTRVSMLGTELATPIGVAPTAFHRLAHDEGEVATATGAARAGSLYVLSTRSTRRIEEVAEASAAGSAAGAGAAGAGRAGAGGAGAGDNGWWFQVYVTRDRDIIAGLVKRAAAAGARALVLTGDTPEPGRKRRSGREGLVPTLDFMVNVGLDADPDAVEQTADVTFADIAWLREVSGGLPVIVKGVLRPDDAQACVEHGASGVIVSNHGGRQLDGALPTALALPGVVAALRESSAEVYVDGGLRSGEDVLTALALGARAVFVGRPVLWSLACDGADGVHDLLAGLTDSLRHAMALAGAPSLADIPGIAVTAARSLAPPQ
jgi:4-hydroxymandelate oxidase